MSTLNKKTETTRKPLDPRWNRLMGVILGLLLLGLLITLVIIGLSVVGVFSAV